jgi:hypothetical protein
MNLKGLIDRGVVATCVMLCVLALSASTAGATGFVFGGSFGSFSLPRGIAVDNSTSKSDPSAGDVYVADFVNQRVVKFNAAGSEQLAELTFTPTAAQEKEGLLASGFTWGVAVDTANGDVYAASTTAVTEYSPVGVFVSQISERSLPEEKSGEPVIRKGFLPFGVAVAPATGELYVADSTNHVVDRFSATGEYEMQFADEAKFAETIAMGLNGEIYVTDGRTAVREFSASGVPVVTPPCASNVIDANTPQSVAVDPSNGAVFVGENAKSEAFDIVRYSTPCAVPTDTFGEGHFGNEGSYGIAVGAAHTVYATSSKGNIANIFDFAVPLPSAVTGSATSITPVSEKLCGTVNPLNEELVASYQFEYGLTESYGHFTPGSPVSIGTGETPQEVCSVAEGLEPEKTYQYQVVASNVEGSKPGGNAHFTTPPAVEEVFTGEASNVAQNTATLNGLLNPDELETHYYFQYGPTAAYGSLSPGLPGTTVNGPKGEEASASTNIGGLKANSPYHYRLVATNKYGTTYGRDQTLTTPPNKPSVVLQAVTQIFPRQALLHGLVNPEGADTKVQVVYGPTESYGSTVPIGPIDLGSGSEPVQTIVGLEGLQPGTTYHYAILATNRSGTTVGPDQTFQTPPAALPAVTTGPAIEVSQNSARITGSVNPEGVSTSYEFDLGTDTTYGSSIFGEAGSGTQPRALSLRLQGLAPGTVYHYRLLAANTYGTVYGADQTFTTPGFPSSLIPAPLAAPLVPIPTFSPPSTTNAVTVKATTPTKKTKTRKKTSKHGKKASRKTSGRKARRAARSIGKRRSA